MMLQDTNLVVLDVTVYVLTIFHIVLKYTNILLHDVTIYTITSRSLIDVNVYKLFIILCYRILTVYYSVPTAI